MRTTAPAPPTPFVIVTPAEFDRHVLVELKILESLYFFQSLEQSLF